MTEEDVQREYTFHGLPSAPFREPKYFSSNIPVCSPPLHDGWLEAIENSLEWRVPTRVPCEELKTAFSFLARLHRETVLRFGPIHQFLSESSTMFTNLSEGDRKLLQKWARIPNTTFTTAEDDELLEVVQFWTDNRIELDIESFTRIGAEYHALHAEEVKNRYVFLKRQKREARKWTPEEMMIIRQEYQRDPLDEAMYNRMVERLDDRTHSACLRKLEFILYVDENAGQGANYYDALQWGNEEVSVGNEMLTEDEENQLVEAVQEYHVDSTPSRGWEIIAHVLPGERDPYFLEQLYYSLELDKSSPAEWTSEEDRILSNVWSSMVEPDYCLLALELPRRIPATCYKRMQELIERTRNSW